MRWYSIETHAHTFHSDGKLSVQQLLDLGERQKLDVISITDHNTDSALDEVSSAQRNPMVLRGMEWTTYYGHVIVLAAQDFIEFRDLTPVNLDSHIQSVHGAKGIVFAAHPCDPGEPFCTGCHWDFHLNSPGLLDGIEIWHEDHPYRSLWNKKAEELWISLLNQGCHLIPVSSSDWHDAFSPDTPYGINYFYLDESLPLSDAFHDAAASGRSFITMGPLIDLSIQQNGNTFSIGDSVPAGRSLLSLSLHKGNRQDVWNAYELHPDMIEIHYNQQVIVIPFEQYDKTIQMNLNLAKGYVYVKIMGTIQKEYASLLVTAPCYVI